MATITVHSAETLSENELRQVRYIMHMARDRDAAISNIFPDRFRKRDGDNIYFDKGKRRYTVHFEV